MRLLSVVVASCALATRSLAAQDEQVFQIIDILKSISANTTTLIDDINAWDGTALGSSKPLKQVSVLIADIVAGNNTVAKFGPLIETDTLRLEPPVNDLTHLASKAITTLVDRKVDIFDQMLGGVVEQLLQQTQSSAKHLSDTIVSLVPNDLRDVANTLAAGIANNLQDGVLTFQCLTCDAYTGKENTCDPAKDPSSCYKGDASTGRSYGSIVCIGLALLASSYFAL